MINRKTLAGLAALTIVLAMANAAIGSNNDVLWVVDDILFFGFLASVVALVGLTVGVLVRGLLRSRTS